MRLAAYLFWLCATEIVAYNVFGWLQGSNIRITLTMVLSVVVYGIVGLGLWQRRKHVLPVGVALSTVALVFHCGAAYFLLPMTWPDIAGGRISASGTLFPFAVPVVLNLIALAALIGPWMKGKLRTRTAGHSTT